MSEATDLDDDGLLDIITIDERRGAAIYFGQRDSTFSSGMALNDGGTHPYALADLDGDGLLDIAAARSEAPSAVFFAEAPRSGVR